MCPCLCRVQITLDDSSSSAGGRSASSSAQATHVLDARLAKLQSQLQSQDSPTGRRSSLTVLVARLLDWSFRPKARSAGEKGGARVLQATGETDTDEVKPPVDMLAKTGRLSGSKGGRLQASLTGSKRVTTDSLGGSQALQETVPTELDTLQHHFLGEPPTALLKL